MIDVHSHVLYGMDDGASSIEDSRAMLDMAVEHGTTDIVATPHANLDYTYSPEVIDAQIKELSAQYEGKIRLHRGCDFHLTYQNIQDALQNPRKYTVAGKQYLLVEFSEMIIFNSTTQIFEELMSAGMVPIVTHPERNWLLRGRLESLEAWTQRGVLLQVTAGSLLNRFGSQARDFSVTLLDRGLVHVIASDAHNTEGRSPRLDEARAWLTERYSEEHADALLVANPKAIVTGEPLPAGPEWNTQGSKKWYQFWR